MCSAKPHALMGRTTAKGRLAIQRTCCAALPQRKGPSVQPLAKLSILVQPGLRFGAPDQWPLSWLAKKRRCHGRLQSLRLSRPFVPALGSDRAALQHHIRLGVGHARQYAAFGLFFRTQARPFDVIAHASFNQMADAGAAGAIAAGTGPVDAALLHGSQQRLFGPGIALGAVGLDAGDEKCPLSSPF